MAFTLTTTALVLVAVTVGAVLQRLSGTGMGLILAPILSLVLGPASGVLVSNATTCLVALMMFVAMRRAVEWRRVALICACSLPGALLGGVVVRQTSAGWLQVLVGGVVLGAITITAVADRLGRMPRATGWWVTPLAALVGGVFNTTAGVSAPAMVVHARLVRWEQQAFAASMQPVFCWMGFWSVVVKSVMNSAGATLPPWWLMPAVLATAAAGILVGGVAARRVSSQRAGSIAVALAGLGGASALVRGLLTVWG